jgi:hypothetical protein
MYVGISHVVILPRSTHSYVHAKVVYATVEADYGPFEEQGVR